MVEISKHTFAPTNATRQKWITLSRHCGVRHSVFVIWISYIFRSTVSSVQSVVRPLFPHLRVLRGENLGSSAGTADSTALLSVLSDGQQ